MLAVAVLPVLDVRSLVEGETGRTNVPFWPSPAWGDEFVRSFGALRPRPRRGVGPWLGEANFVDARRGVKFAAPEAPRARRLVPAYRRIYSDGVVGRLEIGMRCPTPTPTPTPGDRSPDLSAAVEDVAAWRLQIAHQAPVSVVRAGGPFARALLTASTRRSMPACEVQPWWMTPGSPMVLVEAAPGEVDAAGTGTALAEDRRNGVRVEQRWITVAGRRTSAWSLVASPELPPGDARAFRLHLVRCHSELEGTRALVRLGARGVFGPVASAQGWRDLLHERLRFLLRERYAGLPQRAIIETVLDSVVDAYAEEIDAVVALADQLGTGLGGMLHDFAAMLRAAAATPSPTYIQLNIGTTMTDNSLSITGPVANAQAGQGNRQDIGAVHQTTGSDLDLERLVATLVEAFGTVRPQLPPTIADEGGDLVDALGTEAAKQEPDPGRLARWTEKIRLWAEEVGEVAVPVLTAVGAIAAAL